MNDGIGLGGRDHARGEAQEQYAPDRDEAAADAYEPKRIHRDLA